jgi:radical SAM protein with 4Fe4S-binding SPASM domain
MAISRDVVFELTLQCNLECLMCPRPAISDHHSHMPFELLEAALYNISDDPALTAYNISFGGLGEPLIYPKIFEAIELVKKILPKRQLTITTNGHSLNDKNISKLLLAYPDYLRISLNATTPSEYLRIMKKDAFNLVETQIKKLLEFKKISNLYFKVGVQILRTEANNADFARYLATFSSLLSEYDFITLRDIETRAGIIIPQDITGGLVVDEVKIRPPCSSIWRYIAVDAGGDVFACCEAFALRDRKTALRLGSLRDKNLGQIVNSSQLRELREMHMRNDLSSLPECQQCTKFVNDHNIWEYKDGIWHERLE